jgi:predicted membrane chloride channel (bestrophin family)
MNLKKQAYLLLRVSIFVCVIVGAKLIAHYFGWEFISVNPLFSGIVAANVFLMGFLLSGVLSDYKESERLPGELSASLENLTQEIIGINLAKPGADVSPCLNLISQFNNNLLNWFHKKYSTTALLENLNQLTPQFALLEQWTQGTLLARLKQEQSNLRRTLVRIHTIRETSFISAGYLLADITTFFLCIGLIVVKIESFAESLFFVSIISYLMIFLLLLIRDLDNPFGFYERNSSADVSLKPLQDTALRLEAISSEYSCSKTEQS